MTELPAENMTERTAEHEEALNAWLQANDEVRSAIFRDTPHVFASKRNDQIHVTSTPAARTQSPPKFLTRP